MTGSAKANTLNRKFFANQLVQIDAGDDDVSPQHSRRLTRQAKILDQTFENLRREKGDLSLVILPVIVIAIAANSVARDALDLRHFHEWVVFCRLPMVSEIIVTGRNEDLLDPHGM